VSAQSRGSQGEEMLKFILSLFTVDQQAMLENYIASRRPTSSCDVEKFIRDYERISTFK
jgi:hypothetical protein